MTDRRVAVLRRAFGIALLLLFPAGAAGAGAAAAGFGVTTAGIAATGFGAVTWGAGGGEPPHATSVPQRPASPASATTGFTSASP